MSHLNDHPEIIDADADDDVPPRSYAREYVILERTDQDDPMWVLTTVVMATEAKLDETGQPTDDEKLRALQWACEQLDRLTFPQSVPGNGHVYRIEDGEE